MYQPLVPCPECHRHVSYQAAACPFCSVSLVQADSIRGIAPDTRKRMSRAALLMFGATVALAGCSGDDTIDPSSASSNSASSSTSGSGGNSGGGGNGATGGNNGSGGNTGVGGNSGSGGKTAAGGAGQGGNDIGVGGKMGQGGGGGASIKPLYGASPAP